MNGQATILLDQDQVLAEWYEGVLNLYAERYPNLPVVPVSERTSYDLKLYHPSAVEREALRSVLEDPDLYANLVPVPGARQAVREMREAGFDVRVCTKPYLSNPTCASQKLAWIRKHFGHTLERATTLTSDKTLVVGDILIDDHPNITGHNPQPSWTQVYFTRPHNAALPGPRLHEWARWRDAVREVLESRSRMAA